MGFRHSIGEKKSNYQRQVVDEIEHLVDEFRFDHILNISKPQQNG